MATATATLKINGFPNGMSSDTNQILLYGTCTLSGGGTYATNGIPLNWSKLTNPDGTAFTPLWGPGTTGPQTAYFQSTTGSVFYSYKYDTVNNTLRIASAATELANAAAITADTIQFEAHFAKDAL